MANHYVQRYDLSKYTLKSFASADEMCADTNDGDLLKYDANGSQKVVALLQGVAPVSLTGSSATITSAAHAGRLITLNHASGTTVALPAASGTGNSYYFVVGTIITSVGTVVSCASGDSFFGGILINDTGDTAPATADFWPTTNSGSVSNTLTLTANAEGSIIGDWFEVIDIGTNQWSVKGTFQGAADPSSPFNHV